MNNLWFKVRPFFRSCYRFFRSLLGFIYDLKRYYLYSSLNNNNMNKEERNYLMAMTYHGLEKSMSYKIRNPKSGWRNAEEVVQLLNIAKNEGELGFHDRASINVLGKFINLPENEGSVQSNRYKDFLAEFDVESRGDYGVLDKAKDYFERGILEEPEKFFLSRYSLREFDSAIIPSSLIKRAVSLAMKSPSVCNRQAWAVYCLNKHDVREKFLELQNGNKPFGKNINNLLIIAVDLKGFFTGEERYQYWIDGGLFSMSLIYAFHSLGVASCPLNWSQSPKIDNELRSKLKIEKNHTVIMGLAIGYPQKNNKVCCSARRPVDEVLFELRGKE